MEEILRILLREPNPLQLSLYFRVTRLEQKGLNQQVFIKDSSWKWLNVTDTRNTSCTAKGHSENIPVWMGPVFAPFPALVSG